MKRELENPSMVAYHRDWRRVEAELRGTVLIIRTHVKGRTNPQVRTYTLQAADAGIAVDYTRRSHCIRVRAEGEQFLLATTDLVTVVNWVERLNSAIAISLVLDEREDPKFRMLPITRPPLNPGFSSEFRRKVREEWCQPTSTREWLARPQQCPETQSPFLLPAPPSQTTLAASRRRTSSTSSSPTLAVQTQIPAQGATPTQPARDSSRITLMVDPTRRNGSLSSIVYVRIESDPYEPCKDGAYAISSRTNFDYIRGCARALRYSSTWRGGIFIKAGKSYGILEESTIAYLARRNAA